MFLFLFPIHPFISVEGVIILKLYYFVWAINSAFCGVDCSICYFSLVMFGTHNVLVYKYTDIHYIPMEAQTRLGFFISSVIFILIFNY